MLHFLFLDEVTTAWKFEIALSTCFVFFLGGGRVGWEGVGCFDFVGPKLSWLVVSRNDVFSWFILVVLILKITPPIVISGQGTIFLKGFCLTVPIVGPISHLLVFFRLAKIYSKSQRNHYTPYKFWQLFLLQELQWVESCQKGCSQQGQSWKAFSF